MTPAHLCVQNQSVLQFGGSNCGLPSFSMASLLGFLVFLNPAEKQHRACIRPPERSAMKAKNLN